ncbi:phage minor head protein [Actinomadura rudentiformis]|uniref:Phage head morphogenesis protein n=1 Tax=Actinomadura rudentiformis TaxID=359158 RepID=A0A6H9Z0F1_9ACTN|nr:phage minor head protein [Actinomadura rudentiformis]KAB2347341.1 phage head morphogenesis protein [Actinomadura rudentiformis]
MAFTSRTLGLARVAITAAGRVIDNVVRTLTAAWVKAWDAIVEALTAALERLLTGAQQWPGRRTLDRDHALQGALNDAATALDALTDLIRSQVSAAASTLAQQAARDQAAIIDSQLPPGEQRADRTAFLQRAIDAITARTRQRITALTRPLTRDADTAMRRELVRGVTLGRNPRDTARRMLSNLEHAFNGGLNRALTIARTETLDAYRQAAAAAQEDSRGVLSGWIWLAKLDSRGCPACWAMHGTEHPLTEPGPLGHPQCRCSRAPRTKSWRDLGFDLDEPEDLIPDAETLFRALPREQQLQIMGAARLALFDQGAIAWRDLARRRSNDGWRDDFAVTPVRDLTRSA